MDLKTLKRATLLHTPVIVLGFVSNGRAEHLAFVTAVNEDDTVNLTMLPDLGGIHMLTSVPHAGEEGPKPSHDAPRFITLDERGLEPAVVAELRERNGSATDALTRTEAPDPSNEQKEPT
jgi:hypothetical protein